MVCAQQDDNESAEILQKKGIEAFSAGDYIHAEQFFLAAFDKGGDPDILWLNLGRTYARQNRCIEAKEAYKNIQLEKASPIILQKYTDYQKDLLLQCSVPVQFLCTSNESQVYIDDIAKACECNETYYLTPGVHEFKESTPDSTISGTVKLQAASEFQIVDFHEMWEEQRLAEQEQFLNLENAQKKGLQQGQQETRQLALHRKYFIIKVVGYSLLGAGAATAATSGVIWGYDYWYMNDRFKQQSQQSSASSDNKDHYIEEVKPKYDRQPALIASVAAGSAIAVTGAILIAVGHAMDAKLSDVLTENDTENTEVSLQIMPVMSASPSSISGGVAIRF